MFDPLLQALGAFLDPINLLWLILGVSIGWWVGIIPGIGGIVGVAIILPFLYGMDPTAGIFLLIGIFAVNNTSDTFPAVIFGIPGGASSAATIMDGHALARKGMAGRALGAAFIASMLGGIFGALVLLAVLPIVRPLVLSFGSPELLALTVLGLIVLGLVSRGAVMLGVMSAFIGLGLATIGLAPALAEIRFTFGFDFLSDGLSVVVIAIGLFGVPEMLHLLTHKTSVAEQAAKSDESALASVGSRQLRQGARDTFQNVPLAAGASTGAALLATIPGLGGSVITWLVWALSGLNRKKTKVPLGQGEIRGVIGPEAANNATDGGNLIPTLFFGVPGSGGMALFLAGLTLMGVSAGPTMLQADGITIVLTIVMALCVANILGTAICFGIARWVAKLSFVPGRIIVPFLMVTLTLATFQDSEKVGMLFVMLLVGVLGWAMLNYGIPRVPVLVGFVLGDAVERYLWISVSRFGADWLTRPTVWIIVAFMVALVLAAIRLNKVAARAGASGQAVDMKWR